MACLLVITCSPCVLAQHIGTCHSVTVQLSRMKVEINCMVNKCIRKLAKAYCLWKATVATHFCGVQHQKSPVMQQLFAVVTCWHPQFIDQSVPWYAQAVVAQYMVESKCGSLQSICTICHIAIIVSASSQSSSNKSHHGCKNVFDVRKIFVSLNLQRLVLQCCKSAGTSVMIHLKASRPVSPCHQ